MGVSSSVEGSQICSLIILHFIISPFKASLSTHSMVPAHLKWVHISSPGKQVVALLHWPQDIVDPDDVAFMRGFVVDGDSCSGLDPQVASSPLEPTIVTCHNLAFPQHWRRGEERKAVHDDGSRGRLSQVVWARFQQAPLTLKFRQCEGGGECRSVSYITCASGCDSQSSWLCRRFSRSSTWMKW